MDPFSSLCEIACDLFFIGRLDLRYYYEIFGLILYINSVLESWGINSLTWNLSMTKKDINSKK